MSIIISSLTFNLSMPYRTGNICPASTLALYPVVTANIQPSMKYLVFHKSRYGAIQAVVQVSHQTYTSLHAYSEFLSFLEVF